MPALHPIPRSAQREEAWANGAGVTRVILREPDDGNWRVRISVATVAHEGPFSALPDTRRMLVPLDAPMTLRFPDGRELAGARFGVLRFDGTPAPLGLLPGGPTRDFNLMLRDGARGEVYPRPLTGSIVLPPETDVRWLLYLDSGSAAVETGSGAPLALNPHDAVLVPAGAGSPRTVVEGSGEIVLVKLYA